ncbi:MAG: hypothetical protein JWQ96_137 [Segetibacter sp.]|nr:hypothetical protein [Segetibacter sp.]
MEAQVKILSSKLNKVLLTIFFVLFSVVTFAQDGGGTKKVDVNISTGGDGGGGFFASPWVWVVGVAVFILLLVALLRGGSRRDV